MPVIHNVCHECRIYMPYEHAVRRCPFNRNHALQEQSVIPEMEMPLYVAVDRNGNVVSVGGYTQPYAQQTDPVPAPQQIPAPNPQPAPFTDFRDILQKGSVQDFGGDDGMLRTNPVQNPQNPGVQTAPYSQPSGQTAAPAGNRKRQTGTRSFFGRVTQTGTIQNLNTRYAPSPKPALTALYDFLVFGAAGGSAYQTFTLLTDSGHTNLDVLIWGAHTGRGTPLSENAEVRLIGRMQGAQLIPRYVYVNGDTRRTRFRADPPPAHSWVRILLVIAAAAAVVYGAAALLGNPDVINLIKTLFSNLIFAALLCLFIGPLRRLAANHLWIVPVLAVILTFFGGQLLNMLLPVAVGIFFFWLILTAIRGH